MPRSPKLQRLTSMAVPALLAANAMVLVLGLAGITDDPPAGAATVTYIQAADGSLQVVDPTTPEGWKAIADAERRGDSVVTVGRDDAPASVVQQMASTTTVLPEALVTVPDVDGLLDSTESTIVGVVGQVGDTVDGIVKTVTDIVDGAAGTDTGGTVGPAVDEATDTLTTTVSTVVETVRDTATTVVSPVTSVVTTPTTTVPITVPPALPTGGLLDPVLTPTAPGLPGLPGL